MTTGYRFPLAGEEVVADPSGVLWWPSRRMLIVADLHLEKGSRFRLPPYDTVATLDRLEAAIRRLRPREVLALGDSFDDPQAGGRLPPCQRARLERLIAGHAAWIWLTGNHDPDPPEGLGGEVAAELRLGALLFRHEPDPLTRRGEVGGHLHPKMRLPRAIPGVLGRCFATDGQRIVLPAFGAYTGGLDVSAPPIRRLFGPRYVALLLGRQRIHAFPVG